MTSGCICKQEFNNKDEDYKKIQMDYPIPIRITKLKREKSDNNCPRSDNGFPCVAVD